MKISYVGEIRLGDALHKQVYLAMSGTPVVEDGGLEFKPTGAWIGNLPVHPKLVQNTDLFQRYFGKLFGKFDAEKQALEKLSSITVVPGKTVLNYQPPAGK
jgi:hypothetical protein